ncbi:hypothetical protein MPLA_750012 [Mesorhizobium sp. ORS 3359]|uniref:Uncharacterized protein n=1 Tax=Mesorhizobium plurifarium TaxID=69974 RepID=A0A090GAN5_MESPL|nr:hypothetical protein MPLA_750012 [Mesorhizobium sp. ORS 3359]CDX56005.1 hypothetical protein MPL3365_220005 [Mesorhizobium plurifarium]
MSYSNLIYASAGTRRRCRIRAERHWTLAATRASTARRKSHSGQTRYSDQNTEIHHGPAATTGTLAGNGR